MRVKSNNEAARAAVAHIIGLVEVAIYLIEQDAEEFGYDKAHATHDLEDMGAHLYHVTLERLRENTPKE